MKKQKAKSSKKPISKSVSKSVSKKPAQAASAGSSKIMPLGDRVLVKPFFVEETETKNDFGIIIPETVSKEQPEQGRVIAVGEGKYENGKLVPLRVKVGDKVIFSKYAFDQVKDGSNELYILKEESILAIIR